MSDKPGSGTSCLVPIVVAVITALGGIAVALINNWPGALVGTPAPGAEAAPSIAGQYRLGIGSDRIITITETGPGAYSIEETQTPWPFHGTIMATGGTHYEGLASFDGSLATMRVLIDRNTDGTLDTVFDFQTDENGYGTTREDPHLLVPNP